MLILVPPMAAETDSIRSRTGTWPRSLRILSRYRGNEEPGGDSSTESVGAGLRAGPRASLGRTEAHDHSAIRERMQRALDPQVRTLKRVLQRSLVRGRPVQQPRAERIVREAGKEPARDPAVERHLRVDVLAARDLGMGREVGQ